MGKPTIRFKGYTDDCEQRKLGDYLEVSKEKNRDALFGKEDVLSVSGEFGIVNQIEFQGRSFAGVSVANYGVVEVEDVVYTKSPLKSNPYGIIKTNKGKSGIVSTLYAVYKPKNNVDSEFVQIYFELDSRMNSYMHPLVNKGAKNDMKVSDENALKGPVIFPSIEEQKTISQYFDKLNCLITLHQCKCDQAKILKKYMLQKMFPQNDEKVPKIRFKSFTDDWEQRKLGELGTVQTCKRIFKEQTSEQGDIPFFKNGTIGLEPDSYISREVYEEFRRLYPYPEVGDTLISVVGSIGRTAEYAGKDEYFQDSNVVWLKTDGSINKKFLKISYQVIKWLIEGSTVKHLYNNNILRSEIVMPVSQIEQAKIAEFFEALDHLITLHQHKCEELKNIKKFMLQNMFVQEK